MSDNGLVPATDNSPQTADDISADAPAPAKEKSSFGGLIAGILNFVTLAARVAALTAAALWLKENLHLLKAHMHRNADTARRLSEMCDQAGVDTRFTAQILEVSQAFDRVADASGVLANTADQMEFNARDVHNAHESEYRGVYEAVNASPYEQPKPGFNRVR